jgi:prepilin-type N-terminal cleavage/methylation domain-containing protein
MKKGFTITELLVAIGLLAAVLAVSSVIFNYSIDAQRTASATSEVMRTLRAITDQLNINLGFQGLQKDGYLVLWSSSDSNDAIYFFSTGDFQSWYDPSKSNIARVYFGPVGNCPNDLALDFVLLTPGLSSFPSDYCDVNFADCQNNADCLGIYPIDLLTSDRPSTDIASDPNNMRSLLAQNIGSIKIEWTYGWFDSASPTPDRILWWGVDNHFSDATNLIDSDGNPVTNPQRDIIAGNIQETLSPATLYTVEWNPFNQQYWPKALKFTFTLYDSKGILKNGRRFEHIVYIGD